MAERKDFKPGMLVEHRTTYRVRADRYGSAETLSDHRREFRKAAKLEPIGSRWVVTRQRWTVWRAPQRLEIARGDGELTHVRAGQWVAHTVIDDEDGYREPFGVFETHAEAIAYADRMARTPKEIA